MLNRTWGHIKMVSKKIKEFTFKTDKFDRVIKIFDKENKLVWNIRIDKEIFSYNGSYSVYISDKDQSHLQLSWIKSNSKIEEVI